MNRFLLAAALALLPWAAQAEAPRIGYYATTGEAARVVMPQPDAAAPGQTATVLLPVIGGGGLREVTVTLGETVDPTETDLMVLESPGAWAVQPVPGDEYFGIAVLGGPAGDVDGNGVAETPIACTSSESVQLALTEGEGAAMRLVWWQAIYLGYDTEPTCPEALFAAIERLP